MLHNYICTGKQVSSGQDHEWLQPLGNQNTKFMDTEIIFVSFSTICIEIHCKVNNCLAKVYANATLQ